MSGQPKTRRAARRKGPTASSSSSNAYSTSAGLSGHSFHTFDVETSLRGPEDEPILTSVERTSTDRRRVFRDFVPVAPPSPVKRARLNEAPTPTGVAADDGVNWDDDRYDIDLDDPPVPVPTLPRAPRAVRPSVSSQGLLVSGLTPVLERTRFCAIGNVCGATSVFTRLRVGMDAVGPARRCVPIASGRMQSPGIAARNARVDCCCVAIVAWLDTSISLSMLFMCVFFSYSDSTF
jgi:hypothetical protein